MVFWRCEAGIGSRYDLSAIFWCVLLRSVLQNFLTSTRDVHLGLIFDFDLDVTLCHGEAVFGQYVRHLLLVPGLSKVRS